MPIWPYLFLVENPWVPIHFSWSLPCYGSFLPLLFHLMPLYQPYSPSSLIDHNDFVSSLNVPCSFLLLDLCSCCFLFLEYRPSTLYQNWTNLYSSLTDYHRIHLLWTLLESPGMGLMPLLRALIKLNAYLHHTALRATVYVSVSLTRQWAPWGQGLCHSFLYP